MALENANCSSRAALGASARKAAGVRGPRILPPPSAPAMGLAYSCRKRCRPPTTTRGPPATPSAACTPLRRRTLVDGAAGAPHPAQGIRVAGEAERGGGDGESRMAREGAGPCRPSHGVDNLLLLLRQRHDRRRRSARRQRLRLGQPPLPRPHGEGPGEEVVNSGRPLY